MSAVRFVTSKDVVEGGVIASGLCLLAMAWVLPASRDVVVAEARVSEFVELTADQVQVVRSTLEDLDQRRVDEIASGASAFAEQAAALVGDMGIDFDSVEQTSEAMAGIADGLDSLLPAMNVEHLNEVSGELEAAAAAIDDKVIPASRRASEAIAKASASAESRARVFADSLRAANLDGSFVFELSESLGDFGESVGNVAGFVRAVDATIPAISRALARTADELRSWHETWVPIGGLVDREGLAEKAEGLDQAVSALESMSTHVVPGVLESLDRAVAVMDTLTAGSRNMIEHREEIDAFLKQGPDVLVSMASEMGDFGRRLADIIGETERVASVASVLRTTAKQASSAGAALPAARKVVAGAASAARAARQRLMDVSENRQRLAESGPRIAEALQASAERVRNANREISGKLESQKEILRKVESHCLDLQRSIPSLRMKVSQVVVWGRLFAFFMGLTLVGQGAAHFARRSVDQK